MVTIAVSEIKNFISKSSAIGESNRLPIYSYVKLVCKKDRSYFVKHSGSKFIVFDVDVDFKEEQTLMIETKPFFGFVKATKGKEIKITLDEKNIILNDGSKRPLSCQTTKDLFPIIPDHTGVEKFEISQEVKHALVIAKNHTLPYVDTDSMRPWNTYVHIRPINEVFYVIGTRGEITYYQGFKEPLPEISLEPEVISALKDLPHCTYYSVENYDYFELLGTLYGFSKSEGKCAAAVDNVLSKFKSDDSFEVEKQPLVDFCELVLSVNAIAVFPQIKIEGKKKKEIIISFEDISDNVKTHDVIPVENKTFNFEEKLFNPKNLLTVLKDVAAEKIKIMYSCFNFVITTDKEFYIGAAMEQAVTVNA